MIEMRRIHQGIPVSPGVAVAPAYCLLQLPEGCFPEQIAPEEVARELLALEQACESAAHELRELIERVSREVGDRESGIFQSQLFMLRDHSFLAKVKTAIAEKQQPAATALETALSEYEGIFAKIPDEYLRERISDLRDVVARMQKHLCESPAPQLPNSTEPVILVAEELFPSQTVALRQWKIAGIVTQRGGETSHSAIIARSMGIPAISGINNLLEEVHSGELLALDGRDGHLVLNPGPEAVAAFRKLEREFFQIKGELIENRDHPAVSRDRVAIELLANINNLNDARAAQEVGAAGVGLYRTEYLFMTHPSIPDEEEQIETYRKVIEASPNQRVTIRTLDLGGDKTVSYLSNRQEMNPFMGWRSIRLSFEHPDFFMRQIRAILRAGVYGKVRMMFPMVTTLEELLRIREYVESAKAKLQSEDKAFSNDVPLGIMLEVPAAAICLDHLLEHTEFVSIGSNDLIQYIMAADRDNPKVAHLCDPLSAPVLRILDQSIQYCLEYDVPVTVCGEMAGRPRCVLLLLAFGLRQFSMSPAFVPIVKELINSVHLADISNIVDDVLALRTRKAIREFTSALLRQLAPKITAFELNQTDTTN